MISVRQVGWRAFLLMKCGGFHIRCGSEVFAWFGDGYANLLVTIVSELARLRVESGTSLSCHKFGKPFKLLFIIDKSL